MPIGYIYWVCFLIYVLLGFWGHRAEFSGGNYFPVGGHLLQTLLLFLLGWGIFGSIVK